MAEFKTAEQYVVARLEQVEVELEKAENDHSQRLACMSKELDNVRHQLCDCQRVLCIIRDHTTVHNNDLTGPYLRINNLCMDDYPDEVRLIADVLGLHLPDDEEDEDDA